MTFYFYDLETSGVNPREQMIMQFAGQRTNDKLEPIGPIDDILVKLNADVLPEPWAITTHGITPQKSISEGITEKEFADWFTTSVTQPGTIITGYNSLRFDDEFMRYTLFRNFYDPYRWHWDQDRSRWDLMDVARMIRALRPDGIEWPFTSDGKPNVKLEHLAKVNGLTQDIAHTADSDVTATVELAQLFKSKQPKMFDYLLGMRHKSKVISLLDSGQPFVYTSGSLPNEHEKTTIMIKVGESKSKPGTFYVYDLRHDPADWKDVSTAQMSNHIYVKRGSDLKRLPLKTISANKCPAVAPLGVLDDAAWKTICLTLADVTKTLKQVASTDVASRMMSAIEDKNSGQFSLLGGPGLAESRLYDGFIGGGDADVMAEMTESSANEISDVAAMFKDDRLKEIAPRYKARNFSAALSPEEAAAWDKFVQNKFANGPGPNINKFGESLAKASEAFAGDENKQFLLSELQLYVQGLIATDY